MLEATFEQPERARPHLERVDEFGSRYGNNWLEASARTQLASLDASAGELDTARSLLNRAAEAIDAAHLSSLTLTFALVTAAQLAMAEGDSQRAATAARRRPWLAPAGRADGMAADSTPGTAARRAGRRRL